MNAQQRKLQINHCLHIAVIAIVVLLVIVVAIDVIPKLWPSIVTNIFIALIIIITFFRLIHPIILTYIYTRKIVVYASSDLCGKSVNLYNDFITPLEIALSASVYSASTIVRRPISGVDEYIAVFKNLKPGKYTVSCDSDKYFFHVCITIQEKITEIDWRS